MAELTRGRIWAMCQANFHGSSPMILQVVDYRRIVNQDNGTVRYKFIVSDGINQIGAMLASYINELAADEGGQIRLNSVIQINECTGVLVQRRKVMIILHAAFMQQEAEVIGFPEDVPPSSQRAKETLEELDAACAAMYQAALG